MATFSRGNFLKLAATGLAAVSLAACSTGSQDDKKSSSNSSASADQNAFPVTIEHQHGSTEIKEEPKKVVGIGWINAEMALSVGIVPVGAAYVDWGENKNHSTDWYDQKAKELGGETKRWSEKDGINFTEIAQAEPDLILAVVGTLSKEDYEKLSKIAPTVAPKKGTDGWSTSWQENTQTIGKALGRESAAKDLVEDVKKKTEDAAAKHSEIKDKTFVSTSLMVTNGEPSISVYTNGDGRVQFLKDLGMKEAEAVAQKKNSSFYLTWPNEQASELKSDILYSWITQASDAQTITKDKVLKQIPAVAKGAVVLDAKTNDTLALNTGLGIQWLLKNSDFVDQVAQAAHKAQ